MKAEGNCFLQFGYLLDVLLGKIESLHWATVYHHAKAYHCVGSIGQQRVLLFHSRMQC